jgi:hypothetical protein
MSTPPPGPKVVVVLKTEPPGAGMLESAADVKRANGIDRGNSLVFKYALSRTMATSEYFEPSLEDESYRRNEIVASLLKAKSKNTNPVWKASAPSSVRSIEPRPCGERLFGASSLSHVTRPNPSWVPRVKANTSVGVPAIVCRAVSRIASPGSPAAAILETASCLLPPKARELGT